MISPAVTSARTLKSWAWVWVAWPAGNERFTTWATSVTKRDWALLEFVPTLSVTYYDNRSSIDFYSFQRWQVLLGFNRRL